MTLVATSILPQLQPVHDLIETALEAAAHLPESPIRARLLDAVSEFTSLRTTQGCSVADVIEHARNLDQANELSEEAARSLLFEMDELTDTSDIECAVRSRCLAEGLITDDADMPDQEWEAVCEEFGLDESFVYSDVQVREHTAAYRAGPGAIVRNDDLPRAG